MKKINILVVADINDKYDKEEEGTLDSYIKDLENQNANVEVTYNEPANTKKYDLILVSDRLFCDVCNKGIKEYGFYWLGRLQERKENVFIVRIGEHRVSYPMWINGVLDLFMNKGRRTIFKIADGIRTEVAKKGEIVIKKVVNQVEPYICYM